MRQQLLRRLFAAAAGAIALAGSASAQAPARPVVAAQPAPVVVAQPAAGPTVPSVPAAAASAPGGPSSGAVIVGNGGCTNCGTAGHPHAAAARGFVMSASGGYYGTDCQTGRGCNNGCGSLRGDLGFALGSCRSFFDPCGPRPLGGHCGGCRTPVYGTGSAFGPMNPCQYDTYMNH